MKNHLTKTIWSILFVLMAQLSLTSCPGPKDELIPTPVPTPSPTPEPEPTPTIVGEWFEDSSSEGVKILSVWKFEEGNQYSDWLGYVAPGISHILETNGTYTTSDNSLSCEHIDQTSNLNVIDHYDIKVIDKYTFTVYSREYSQQEEYHRIVDTYYIQVGDTKKIQIDNNFIPTSYNSTDSRVAVVNNDSIQALKRGTTYISVSSSIGTAVIRIVVQDQGNVIDDYMQYLGVSIDDVTKEFGDLHLDIFMEDKGIFAKTFPLIDDFIKDVVFFYGSDGIISSIFAHAREGVDISVLKQSLAKKYPKNYPGDNCQYYETEKNGRKITIIWNDELNDISYNYRLSDNDGKEEEQQSVDLKYYEFDKLLGQPLSTAESYLGHNYSDSYEEKESSGIGVGFGVDVIGGFRHYPYQKIVGSWGSFKILDGTTSVSNVFNGYERTFEYIELHYDASGSYRQVREEIIDHVTAGNIDKITLKYKDHLDNDEISNNLDEHFVRLQKLSEDDGSYIIQFANTGRLLKDFYVYWNPIKRTLGYESSKRIYFEM